ncbi:hypothetical protein [Agromyces sp. H66]|nr:hypothetical protein [Agromyces sp. H66]
MQRCVGPCGRLLLVGDFPQNGYGRCWDCQLDRETSHPGYDVLTRRG